MKSFLSNSKVKFFLIVFLLLLCCFLFLCGGLTIKIVDSINFTKFYPVEGEVTTSEIIGTWNAHYGDDSFDTITIFADGTYQQTYYETLPGNYRYESEIYDWYLEESSGEIIYLHLEEGKYFLAGRKFLENYGWNTLYDPFSRNRIPWNNELILVVVSDQSNNLILHNLWVSSDRGFPIFKKDITYFIRE